jgi:hypothetical protein
VKEEPPRVSRARARDRQELEPIGSLIPDALRSLAVSAEDPLSAARFRTLAEKLERGEEVKAA